MSARSRVSPPASSSEGAVVAGWLANRPARPRRANRAAPNLRWRTWSRPGRVTRARGPEASTRASACGAARSTSRGRSFAARVCYADENLGAPRAKIRRACHLGDSLSSRSVVRASSHSTRRPSSLPSPRRSSFRPGTHRPIARRARPPRCTRPRASSPRTSPRARPRPRPPRRRRRRGDRRPAPRRAPAFFGSRGGVGGGAASSPSHVRGRRPRPGRGFAQVAECTPSSTAWASARWIPTTFAPSPPTPPSRSWTSARAWSSPSGASRRPSTARTPSRTPTSSAAPSVSPSPSRAGSGAIRTS